MINLILTVVFAILIAGGFVARFIRRRPKRKKPAHSVTVTVDDDQFDVTEAANRVSVRWADITRVTVITTSQGPWFDDLFYHIVYTGGDVTLPSEANGIAAFVEKLSTLPGFDKAAFDRANRSTRNNSFVVVLRNEIESA